MFYSYGVYDIKMLLFTADGDYNRSCPIPCSRTLFEPSISYASLSRRNTESILFRGLADASTDMKRKSVKSAFRNSIDTRQRDTQEIKIYDREKVHVLWERLNHTITSVKEFDSVTKSPDDLGREFKVSDALIGGLSVMDEEYSNWKDSYRTQWHPIIEDFNEVYRKSVGPDLDELEKLFELLKSLYYTMDDDLWMSLDVNSILREYLKTHTSVESFGQCLALCFSLDEAYRDDLFDESYYSEYTDPILNEETICLYALQLKRRMFLQKYIWSLSILDTLSRDVEQANSSYQSAVNAILNYTEFEPTDFPEYEHCLTGLSEIETIVNTVKELLQNTSGIIRIKTNAVDETTFMQRVFLLNETFQHEVVTNISVIIARHRRIDACEWPTQYYLNAEGEKESAMSLMSNALDHHKIAEENYRMGRDLLHDYVSSQARHIVPAVTELQSYLTGNISELDLADYFETGTGRLLLSKAETYVDVHLQFRSAILNTAKATAGYKEAYRKMWNLVIPIYGLSHLWNSPFWKTLLEPSQNSTLQSLMHDVK